MSLLELKTIPKGMKKPTVHLFINEFDGLMHFHMLTADTFTSASMSLDKDAEEALYQLLNERRNQKE